MIGVVEDSKSYSHYKKYYIIISRLMDITILGLDLAHGGPWVVVPVDSLATNGLVTIQNGGPAFLWPWEKALGLIVWLLECVLYLWLIYEGYGDAIGGAPVSPNPILVIPMGSQPIEHGDVLIYLLSRTRARGQVLPCDGALINDVDVATIFDLLLLSLAPATSIILWSGWNQRCRVPVW